MFLSLSLPWPLFAAEFANQVAERNLWELPASFRHSKFQFFPVPYFETSSAQGQRYGVMPTLMWYDQNDDLITIFVNAYTYNPQVVGFGTFAGLFLYPSEREELKLFFATAQDYERDYDLHYRNQNWLDGRFDLDLRLEYIQFPFERFFGFGPNSLETNESNFVSHTAMGEIKAGYEIIPHLDIQFSESWRRMTMQPQALDSLHDTAVFFSNEPEIGDSNQWTHRLSLIWDSQDDLHFPKSGNRLEGYELFAHRAFGADRMYGGYGLEAKNVFTLGERFTTVNLLRMEKYFKGNTVPFIMQHRLGGFNQLRGFIDGRFTGKGKLHYALEERIFIKSWKLFDARFDLSIDPFFEVGQVFDRYGDLAFANLQPVGGIGLRAVIPPSVLGRVDFGFSHEGMEIFTTMDYPF